MHAGAIRMRGAGPRAGGQNGLASIRAIASLVAWQSLNIVLALAVYIAWLNRNEGHLTPETGAGYWLGIAGVSAMVLLLVYPFRKRFRWLAWVGSVPLWFRLHMMLGLLAPTLILLHCNFKLGSTNSRTALIAMLVVAASGVVGRLLYRGVHAGLSERKRSAASYFEAASDNGRGAALSAIALSPATVAQLGALTKQAITPHRSLARAITSQIAVNREATRLARLVRREARDLFRRADRGRQLSWIERRRQRKHFEGSLDAYLAAVRKTASLALFERLFALWHLLHLPLFFLMILATVIHVIAVHLY